MFVKLLILFFCSFCAFLRADPVELGIDRLFSENFADAIKGKRIGLITNHTGVNSQLRSTLDLFRERKKEFSLVAIFTPEHGLSGVGRSSEEMEGGKNQPKSIDGIPVYSLHGATRRPTAQMLKKTQVLVYDIQEIGCRSYTYASTLFYVMEEAAKLHIPVIVLDRPNPMGGIVVDGPMLQEKWRSFLGYVNVPYCHGMTIGELARFFNGEYKIGCNLKVIGMRGWKRTMTYKETGLPWLPTSPYIPEPDTPFYYASTGILGAIGLVNIGIGYTLPFKVVGAPWLNAESFATKLNAQKLPGVTFVPFRYRPFYGLYRDQDCQGVKIAITNPRAYRPLAVQYLIIGMLKSLYPKRFEERLAQLTAADRSIFCKVNGTDETLKIMESEQYIGWKLASHDEEKRKEFLEKRKQYLLY